MPIVSVNLTAGRDDTVKSFIARSVVDAVAELAGVSLDGIQVLFTDRARSSWAIGPRLLSESGPPPPSVRPMPYQRILEMKLVEGRRGAYLSWRRHRLYPVLGVADGFLTTSAVERDDDGLVIIERWRTEQACKEFEATSEYGALVADLDGLVSATTVLVAGSVADTWTRPAP